MIAGGRFLKMNPYTGFYVTSLSPHHCGGRSAPNSGAAAIPSAAGRDGSRKRSLDGSSSIATSFQIQTGRGGVTNGNPGAIRS